MPSHPCPSGRLSALLCAAFRMPHLPARLSEWPADAPRGLSVDDDGLHRAINAAVSSGKDVIAAPCPTAPVSFFGT